MIYFHTEDCNYILPQKKKTITWINNLIIEEGFELGELSYIFVSDTKILEINNQYLKHNYYTDIISFDYVEDKLINGDLFISVDTVKSNSKLLKNKYLDEFRRVLVHGVLHLCGYKDKTDEEIIEMRQKEDYYLKYWNN